MATKNQRRNLKAAIEASVQNFQMESQRKQTEVREMSAAAFAAHSEKQKKKRGKKK